MQDQETHEDEDAAVRLGRAREGGAFLLAAGAFATAIAAASCCALPTVLAALGLGALGLGSAAWIGLSDRPLLLGAAVLCLVGVGVLLLWRRRDACRRPGWRALTLTVAAAAVLFVVLAAVIV